MLLLHVVVVVVVVLVLVLVLVLTIQPNVEWASDLNCGK